MFYYQEIEDMVAKVRATGERSRVRNEMGILE